MTTITTRFKNDLRRVSEVASVVLPAKLEDGSYRLGTPDSYAVAGEPYVALVLPERAVVTRVYLVVEAPMVGTATVTLTNDGTALFTDADITATGLQVSSVVDFYVSTQEGITITLSDDQVSATPGSIRVVAEYISTDTNNGIYGS
jgi:hypothetical protein